MRAFLASALLLTALLAGCSGDKEGDGDGTTTGPTTAPSAPASPPVLHLNITAANGTHRFASAAASGGHGNTTSGSASGTTTASGNASAGGNATGNATDGPAGPAPLDVSFELGASKVPAGAAANWSLDFGRGGGNATNGTTQNGTTLPATVQHTYTSAGQYNVTFILRVGNLTPQALQATIRIEEGSGNVTVGKPAPDQVHFEYGESLGCTGDLPVGITCIDWETGPPGSDVDGHWIPLDDRYWGYAVTTTVDQGNPVTHDTDCIFTDADKAVLGEGNNGSGACLGTVPGGSAWMFVYSYGTPALAMTVDFAPSA